jgi:hypothetical protein
MDTGAAAGLTSSQHYLSATNDTAYGWNMNNQSIMKIFAGFLVCLGLTASMQLFAQQSAFKVDADWAQLPNGETWNGSTSWITADGKGNVVVLVRVAPYFRVFTRDGKFV